MAHEVVENLVDAIQEGRAADIEKNLNVALSVKIAEALDLKREEIGASMIADGDSE